MDNSAKFPPEYVAVVDGDPATGKQTTSALKEIGVQFVDYFSEARQAYQAMKTRDYHAAIIDFRLKDFSGAVLLDKLRANARWTFLPVVLTTVAGQRQQAQMLGDFLITQQMEKPVRMMPLQRVMIELITEANWIRKAQTQMVKALDSKAQDTKTVLAAVDAVVAGAARPVPLMHLAAEHLLADNRHDVAGPLFERILTIDKDNANAMSGLARVYMLSGRAREALVQLRRAQRLIPDNIESLLAMGDVELSLARFDDATASFDRAMSLDPDEGRAKLGKAAIKVYKNFADLRQRSAEQPSLARLLNNIGIAAVREGLFERGLKCYHLALDYLAATDLKAKVSFNLGLGYIRWQKPDEAAFWLKKAVAWSDGQHQKAQRRLREIEDAASASASPALFSLPSASAADELVEEESLLYPTTKATPTSSEPLDPAIAELAAEIDSFEFDFSANKHRIV